MKFKKVALIFIAITSLVSISTAQKVEQFTVDGKTYFGTKAIPKDVIGEYKYEKTKEPIVIVREDGTGVFQVHDVKAYPVEYWIETDEKGVVQKRTAESSNNYQVVLKRFRPLIQLSQVDRAADWLIWLILRFGLSVATAILGVQPGSVAAARWPTVDAWH